MASAILRGAMRKARAPAMAALQAQSPWERSAGTSSRNSGISAWGRAPVSMAFSMALHTQAFNEEVAFPTS